MNCTTGTNTLLRFCLLLALLGCCGGMGCKRGQVKPTRDPVLPSSNNPIIKMTRHRGVDVGYNIYNNSKRIFLGLVIVFDGEGCEGPRSRRLLVKIDAPPLYAGSVRPYAHRLPYVCQKIRLTAFDIPSFRNKVRKDHKPFVQYDHKGKKVIYTVQNRSLLPFRGVAVLIKGQQCEEPNTTRFWLEGTKEWLYPGYKREFTKKLPVECGSITLVAQDLVAFLQRRAAYMKAQQAQQQKLREDAKKLLDGM